MTELPDGFRIDLDRSVRTFRGGRVLVGGRPGRMISLSDDGLESLHRLLAAEATSPAERRLGRRLVEAGIAHPRPVDPARSAATPTVTVVVPTRDRVDLLERCLDSLGDATPVVVVDDASVDPDRVAAVCRRYGARLLRRSVNGGPGAARNEASAEVHTDLIAFVDSDCVVPDRWLEDLLWQFADPTIGAVAPRIRPDQKDGDDRPTLVGYNRARSPLDMGRGESEVGPRRLVRYLPTAALIVRRQALARGFDPELRVGEDVDLVWRMLAVGWRVRFDPSVEVAHHEPVTWSGLLARRFRYGTSAGPLSARHPGRLAPVELRPWPTAAAVAALTGRWRWVATLVAVPGLSTTRKLRPTGVPLPYAFLWSAQGAAWTLIGIGRAATTLAAPVLLGTGLVALRRRRPGRAAAVAALVMVPPLVEWAQRRPGLDPLRWCAASLADDVAYGAGVWSGCLRSHQWGPLLPALGGDRSERSQAGQPRSARQPR